MKALVGLLFSALIVLVSSNTITPTTSPVLKLAAGKSYIYSYNGRLVSGMAQDQSKVALWEIESDIVLQAEQQQQHGSHVAMQMMNVRVGRHQGSATSGKLFANKVTVDHRSVQEYEEQLAKPIRFFWDQGKIKNFEADQNEPQWSINIKKAILSLFNVDLKKVQENQHHQQQSTNKMNDIFGRKSYYDQDIEQKLTAYKTYEDGINGVCETLYQVISAVDERYEDSSATTNVFNVTKTRNYQKCLSGKVGVVEKSNTDIRGAPAMVCDEFDYQTGICIKQRNVQTDQKSAAEQQQSYNESPVDLFNYVKYNISVDSENSAEKLVQIDSIYGQGKAVYETSGKQLLLVTEQNVTLMDKMATTAMGTIRQIRNIMLHQELSYRLPSNIVTSKFDIPYYSLFGDIDIEELKDQLIPSLLQSVARDIEVAEEIQEPSKNTMEKIVQLSNAFAVMSSKHLEEVFEKVASKGQSYAATANRQMKRKLFLDLLSSAGTTEAALLASKLYQEDRITTFEAKEVFETIPQNLFQIDQKVVEAYLTMLLSDKVQQQRNLAASVGIALGKLINQATEAIKTKHQRKSTSTNSANTLDQKQIEQILKVLEKALKSCNTFHQKVALIETLAHTGHSQGLRILSSIVQDTVSVEDIPGYPVENSEHIAQERNFIRQISIYALTHLVRTNGPQVRSLLLPIYQNRYEPYEVRIAAFTVLLINEPGRETLERIASELHTEQNRQVKSFVVSSLKTVSKFGKEPALRKLATDAKFALGMAPKEESLGWQYSKMYGFSRYDQNTKQGVNMMVEWLSSNMSQIPRSGYLAVRQTDDYYSNLALEVGYNVKGLDQIVKRLTESNQLVSSLIESLMIDTSIKGSSERLLKKRNVEQAKTAKETLQALKEKLDLNVRNEEEPKATVFFKLFERTSYYSFDRQFVEQILDEAKNSIKDIMSQLIQGQDYHYVKLVMPKQLYKVVSSEMGLPVVITERHPMILSIKLNQAKLQLADQMTSKSSQSETKSTSSNSPFAVNFTVQVEPALYQTTYNFIFGLTPVTAEAIGTNVEKTTRISVPFDLSVGFVFNTNSNSQKKHQQQQFSFSVTPRMPQEVFHYHQEVKTFVTSAKIAGPPERRWLQNASVIKRQSVPFKFEKEYLKKELGLGLKLKMTSDSGRFFTDATKSYTSTSAIKNFEDICTMILAPIFGTQISNRQENSKAIHLTLESDDEQRVTGYDFAIHYKKFDLIENEDEESDVEDSIYSSSTAAESFKSTTSKSVIKKIVKDMIDNWKNDQEMQTSDSSKSLIAHSVQMVAKTTSGSGKYFVQALQAHSYDCQTYWTSVRAMASKMASADIVSSDSSEQQVCFDSIVAYQQKTPSEFYYEPIASQNLQCKLKARLDFGHDCQHKSTESAHVEFEGVMEAVQASEDEIMKQRDLEDNSSINSQSKTIKQEWFYQQCAEDRANGKSASYACKRAILEDTYFKRLILDVKYDNIPAPVKNLTKKLVLAAKVAFYKNLDLMEYNEEQQSQQQSNKLRIKAQYSTQFSDVPMVDVSIKTPKEKMIFQKIETSFIRPVSALYSTVEVYKNMLNGYQAEDRCVMMEDYLQTFDNVSIELPESKCQYLLAKDCSSSEKFSIFARQLDSETKTKEVTILIDGREIVMSPSSVSSVASSSSSNIRIDGEHVELSNGQVRIMSEGQMTILARQTIGSSANGPMIKLEHEQHQLTIKYDGKNIQVQVGEQYRGEMCGICGDNNHESEKEFSGPDQCLYEREEDFINSYALTGGHCTQIPVVVGGKKCPKQESVLRRYVPKEQIPISRLLDEWNTVKKASRVRQIEYQSNAEEVARAAQRHLEQAKARQQQQIYQQQQQQPTKIVQKLRTMAIRQHDKFCFSVQPVLSCIEGISRPVQVTTQNFGFHCLPSQSIAAQTLVEQSRYQVLEIFGKKQVDFVAPLQVPVACHAI